MPGRGVFLCLLQPPRATLWRFFPDRGQAPYETGSPSIDLVTQRMQTLFHLQSSSPHGCHYDAARRLTVPWSLQSVFAQSCFTLKVGSVIERESLLPPFAADRLSTSFRGGDSRRIQCSRRHRRYLFHRDATEPYRIEFLGDTVESTRRFDPGTQESTESVLSAVLLPAREYLLPPESEASLFRNPAGRRMAIAGHVSVHGHPGSIIFQRRLSWSWIVPSPWLQHAREWDGTAAGGMGGTRHGGYRGFRIPVPLNSPPDWDEFLTVALCDGPSLAFDVVAPAEDSWNPVVTLPLQSAKSVGLGLRGTSFTDTLDDPGTASAVKGRLWSWFDPPDRSGACRGCSPNTTPLRRNGTPGGLQALHPSAANAVLYSARVFFRQGLWCRRFLSRWSPKKISSPKFPGIGPNPKASTATFLSSLDDLNAGDYVVHVQHGISRYKGLRSAWPCKALKAIISFWNFQDETPSMSRSTG